MRWPPLLAAMALFVASLGILILLPPVAQGAASTLLPVSDIATGSWSATPLWSKLDDDVDGPDGTVVSTSTRNDVMKLGQSDSPSDTSTVTAVNLRIHARSTAGAAHAIRVELVSSDEGTVYATFGPTLSSTLTTHSSLDISVSMTKAEIDDAIFRVQSIDSGQPDPGTWEVDAVNNDITYDPGCSAVTVETSDPAGQLWFNETTEPDGVPFTTQVNVSASFQNGTVPALRVTNDGSANCDITLRLMSDPGTGRSMKFNVTSNAPWPDDASREVPVDPSSVTACTAVAPGGTCDVWLWVDYENALGGSLSIALRVEST